MKLEHTTSILSVERISKTFQGKGHEVKALRNVSFELYKGEMLAIMGTSGSGKSTLLNILGALDQPDLGKVWLNGHYDEQMFTEPYATAYRRDHIGFVFQAFHLLKDLSVEENVALPLILQGLSQKEINRKVATVLELIGLTAWKKHRPVQLSGGQQQRVAIGRALITSPPILLADEPTGNLDFNTSTDILQVMTEMKEKLAQSMIVVTHDPAVAAYADRVLFFHDGEIVDEYHSGGKEDPMEDILNTFRKIMERSKTPC